jgi:hypothetical protein
MTGTIQTRAEGRRWQAQFDRYAPGVGDIAPDFELRDSNGQHPLRLADFQGNKPVALIFGSFT